MMIRLAIIGSGDLGQQIAHIARQVGFEVVGFFDDTKSIGMDDKGLNILGSVAQIAQVFVENIFDQLSMGIGYKYMDLRQQLFDQLSPNYPFANIIHPTAYLDRTALLGKGVVVYPGVVVDAWVVLGDNVLLNVGCTIAHDSSIASHCFLSPRVALAGFVSVGECCILGINSTVIDNITIAPKTQIGAGAVVIKQITHAGVYVGVPGRLV